MGKHSDEAAGPPILPWLAGGVAVVVVAAGGVLGVRAMTSSNESAATAAPAATSSAATTTAAPSTTSPSSTTPTSSTPSTTPTSAEQAADATVRAALAACVARQDAAVPVVAAVTTGAQHWSAHVQAQNDLDSGARTLIDVKTNTWGPTRAAGPGDVAAYQGAVGPYASAPACQSPDPAVVALAPQVAPKLQACTTREPLLDADLSAGAAVMQDWQTHLGEMADHADGHTNSSVAQENWLKRWREAPAHLAPYNAAAAALNAAPACTA